jgi:hypothetical protein
MREPLLKRKRRLQRPLEGQGSAVRYCDHQVGLGRSSTSRRAIWRWKAGVEALRFVLHPR